MTTRSDSHSPRPIPAARSCTPARSQALAGVQLRAAAVRVTAARVKVLAALLEARNAVSHQDLQDGLGELDRVTLYRALDCLTDAGLAHKIAGDDRIFRYSAGAEHGGGAQPHAQHSHGHFKCTRCARVFCLDDGNRSVAAPSAQTSLQRQLQEILRQTLGDGFQSHDIELTIKGWCADCAH